MTIAESLEIIWDEAQSAHSLKITSKHLNRNGSVHGGTLCTLADWAMATVVLKELPAEKSTATINMSIDFISVAKPGDQLTAVASIINLGKRLINAQCQIFNQNNQLISRSIGTFIIISRSSIDAS